MLSALYKYIIELCIFSTEIATQHDHVTEEAKVNPIKDVKLTHPTLVKGESFKHKDAMDYYSTGHHQLEKGRKMASKHYENEMDDIRADLIAECYIGFQKLLNDELKAFDLKDSVFFDQMKGGAGTVNSGSIERKGSIHNITQTPGTASTNQVSSANQEQQPMLGTIEDEHDGLKGLIASRKTKHFSEKLWYCGQNVGEISGRLTFYNLPILYQMKVGVLSKKGISFTSKPILLDSQATTQKVLKEGSDKPMKKIIGLKDKLILSDTGRVKQRLTLYEKSQLFGELSVLLQISEKSSMISFIYNNETDLLDAQRHFIELGLHCMEFAEFVDFDAREYYYQSLCHILKRSELDLFHMNKFKSLNS